MSIKPGDVYLGNNQWGSREYFDQLVANGEFRPVEGGVPQLQVVGGGSLNPNYEPSSPQPRSNYAGAAGAPVDHLELPTMTFASEKSAKQIDDKHLPLPSTATK